MSNPVRRRESLFPSSLPGTPVEPAATAAEQRGPGALSHMPMPPLPLHVPNTAASSRNRLSFDFFPGRPSAALFPLKTWRRLLQSNLSHGGGAGLSQYGDPAGLPALRSAIADHLATTRGIAADPSRVIIVSGAQEGISIAARLFLNHGTPSAIEDPCYQGAAFAFEATGSEIVSVAVDFDGLIPEELPQRPTALLYRHAVAPISHRAYTCRPGAAAPLWPGRGATAVTFSKTTATAIFATKVRRAGDRRAGPRLHHLCRNLLAHARGRTAARLYGRARAACRRDVAAAKGLLNQRQSLARSGRTGGDDARQLLCGSSVARRAPTTRKAATILLAALRRNFGDVSVSGEAGGLHVVWYLPPGVPNAASRRKSGAARAHWRVLIRFRAAPMWRVPRR